MKDATINKLLSGRFVLTVIGGVTFAYAVYVKALEPQATAAILTMVFVSYFNRSDRSKENGKEKENGKV